MSKIGEYRILLGESTDWPALVRRASALPGPRANLEILEAAVEEGDEAFFLRALDALATDPDGNSPDTVLAMCGVVGLGKLVAEGRREYVARLRSLASDPRWRIREAVAMALQRWGDRDMAALLEEMRGWSRGGPLERRAAVAGLCEPGLLRDEAAARDVLALLDEITASLSGLDRTGEEFAALKKGLSYGWSVAVAALPSAGRPLLEKWAGSDDPDVRAIVRENLGKNRLRKMDAAWTARLLGTLGPKR